MKKKSIVMTLEGETKDDIIDALAQAVAYLLADKCAAKAEKQNGKSRFTFATLEYDELLIATQAQLLAEQIDKILGELGAAGEAKRVVPDELLDAVVAEFQKERAAKVASQAIAKASQTLQ